MTEEETYVVTLKSDFYRDGFTKLLIIAISFIVAIILLIVLSLYIYLNKPQPIDFIVDSSFRIQGDIPVNQPYKSNAQVLQWVTQSFPNAFNFDFIHYNDQLKSASQFFTSDGWKVFLNQLNIYANYNNVQTNKMFVNGVPAGAPTVISQGLLTGRYAWWVQIPVNIHYAGYMPSPNRLVTFQVLVVRVPTLNNLNGVGINNVIVTKST